MQTYFHCTKHVDSNTKSEIKLVNLWNHKQKHTRVALYSSIESIQNHN